MLLCRGLKMATRCAGSGTSKEAFWCRSSSATVCALPGATWYELRSDLQMVVTCAGLGVAWERLGCKLRLAAGSPGLRLLSKRYGHTEARCCLFG